MKERYTAVGRFYLRESLRNIYEDRFIAVRAAWEIVLIRVPDYPVIGLREATKIARELSTAKSLKTGIEEIAR